MSDSATNILPLIPHDESDEQGFYTLMWAIKRLEGILEQAWRETDPSEAFAAYSQAYAISGEAAVSNWKDNTPSWEDIPAGSRLQHLVRLYRLSDFELTVLLAGCLPAIVVYQGQKTPPQALVSNGRVQMDALLAMLCPGSSIRNLQRGHLLPDATLLQQGLIVVREDKTQGRVYETASVVRYFLLGHHYLPPYPGVNAVASPPTVPLQAQTLCDSWHQARATFPQLIALLVPAGLEREAIAASLAQEMGLGALSVTLAQFPQDAAFGDARLTELFLYATLYATTLIFDADELEVDRSGADKTSCSWLIQRITQLAQLHIYPIVCLMKRGGEQLPLPMLSRWHHEVPLPSSASRAGFLQTLLPGDVCSGIDLTRLTQRAVLSPEAMMLAVQEADIQRCLRGDDRVRERDLHIAFVRRARQSFGKLAKRLTPQRSLNDVVISDDLAEQVEDILAAVRHREDVLLNGFQPKLGRATGISALFHGDPGTGKTLVAEAIAHQLGVDLICIDLSTVVDKYIGETEKNISRIFELAEQDAGVLFFDEAEALFGKRTETKDAKDRHANIEIAYLLQRLEQHPGLVILATNHRSHLDDAFSRRFTFITRFTYPDEDLRLKMWQQAWPESTCLANDIDWARLARVKLTGANIRNVAYLTSLLAANEACITADLIARVLKRELEKVGRIVV